MKHTTPQESLTLDDLYPVEKLAADHPGRLTVATLRWQLRHRADNGLASACVRVGRKLLISKTRYERWLGSRVDA